MNVVLRIAAVALTVAVTGAGCASSGPTSAYTDSGSPSAMTSTSLGSLMGLWDGWAKPPSGNMLPIQVSVNADGTYTSRVGASSGAGTFRVVDGKIVSQGHLTGSAFGSEGQSVIAVSEKNGRQIMSGDGRSEAGPYSFELTKR